MIGNLPSFRICPASTFLRCGATYSGPFLIKSIKGWGCKYFKIYTSLFVCFSTWDIYFESVLDLSAEAFIADLKRFVSHRDKFNDIYGDTNFVQANVNSQIWEIC